MTTIITIWDMPNDSVVIDVPDDDEIIVMDDAISFENEITRTWSNLNTDDIIESKSNE